MKKLGYSLASMFTFLTRLPLPIEIPFDSRIFANGIFFFPVIGLIIGLLLEPLTWLGYELALPVSILSFLLIINYLLIVGGLHIDGLADLFDGIFSARKRERQLEIMSDSHIGTFGCVGIVLYFLGLYIGFQSILAVQDRYWIVLYMPIVGRMCSMFLMSFSSYAKKDGMARDMVERATPKTGIVYVLIIVVLGLLCDLLVSICLCITLFLLSLIHHRIHKKLDGITGDVIGAMIEISQVVFLLVAGVLASWI